MRDITSINSRIWERIRKELHFSYLFDSTNLLSGVISGILIGLMTTILSISFAVLVFGKAIPEAVPIGIGMALVSNVILHLCSAFASSGEGIISHVQSLPPPIQAAMLYSLIGILPTAMSPENKIAIAVFMVLFSAMFTGVILYFFGRLKFGRLVRFLPLPVISGFLVSIGFALVLGGMTTMTNINVTFSSLTILCSIELIIRWMPGIILAIVLGIVTTRWKSVLVFPSTLVLAVMLFYILSYSLGFNVKDLMTRDLLLGPFQSGQLWYPPYIYLSQVSSIDWDWTTITSQLGIIITIPLVCFIGGLLMLSAIEFSTNKEVDPNFELKTMGASNFISGLMGGGFIGYPSTTFTIMQHSLGASSRLAGILSAIIPFIVLILGASFLGFIPRFVVGGLLIYFGYQFIDHWVIKQIRHLNLSDLSVICAIIITSLWLGFVASVGVGILVAACFFLFKYSQTSVIRYVSTGATLRSKVTRNTMNHDWLSTNADCISIFGLQGYIFFGTAYNLHEEIMSRVTDNRQTPLDSVILDFRHVTGIDTSVAQSFHKLYQQLMRKNITLVFAQMPPQYQRIMQKMGFAESSNKRFAAFASLDAALEWREDTLLKNSDLPSYEPSPLLNVLTGHFKDKLKAEALMQYLNRIELSTGTKIIQQGMVAYDLFFVESGRLSTYLEQEDGTSIRLQTMMDDTMVGEIGFYLGLLRTATVVADEPSIVYRLSTDALVKMEKEHPMVAIEFHRLIVAKTAMRINHVFKSVKVAI